MKGEENTISGESLADMIEELLNDFGQIYEENPNHGLTVEVGGSFTHDTPFIVDVKLGKESGMFDAGRAMRASEALQGAAYAARAAESFKVFVSVFMGAEGEFAEFAGKLFMEIYAKGNPSRETITAFMQALANKAEEAKAHMRNKD